jgi:hypothetical protein
MTVADDIWTRVAVGCDVGSAWVGLVEWALLCVITAHAPNVSDCGPHDHMGWVLAGSGGFAALDGPFLAEGAARGERPVYVAADPGPAAVAGLAEVAGPHALQVASIAEVYRASRVVDALSQRATFARALADALAAGYSGIRVAADNTPLVTDEDRLAAWIRWEVVADHFMSENQVTGLCAFDREKVDVDRLRHLATLHPLSSAASPVPQ